MAQYLTPGRALEALCFEARCSLGSGAGPDKESKPAPDLPQFLRHLFAALSQNDGYSEVDESRITYPNRIYLAPYSKNRKVGTAFGVSLIKTPLS